jgi:histidinol-phosphate aminotransferase
MYKKIDKSCFIYVLTGGNIVQPKKTVKDINKYSHNSQERRDKIKLDLNENLMGCSLKVVEALKKITHHDISGYPEYDNFIIKLSSYLDVEGDNLLITNGADDAIRAVMDAYLEKDDEIIIPIPTFYLFELYATFIGAKQNLVYYNDDLSFPVEKILEKINDKTKMIVIVNPNNPTGTIVSDEDIEKILQKAKNSIVLIDEAYFQFSERSSKNLINTYNNLIITQTFSKGFGLAGLRLGYIISNKDVIHNLNKVVLPYGVNGLSIVAGSAALEDLDFVSHYVGLVRDNKGYLEKELTNLGVKTYPSDANFIIANFGEDSNHVYEQLSEKDILVKDVSNQPMLEGCLRIAIGTKTQMVTLIKELRNIL